MLHMLILANNVTLHWKINVLHKMLFSSYSLFNMYVGNRIFSLLTITRSNFRALIWSISEVCMSFSFQVLSICS